MRTTHVGSDQVGTFGREVQIGSHLVVFTRVTGTGHDDGSSFELFVCQGLGGQAQDVQLTFQIDLQVIHRGVEL